MFDSKLFEFKKIYSSNIKRIPTFDTDFVSGSKGSDTDFVSGSKGSDTDFVSGSKGSKLIKSFIREQKFQTNKSQNTESLCSYSWLNSTIESISYLHGKIYLLIFYYLVMVQAKLVPIITVEVVKEILYTTL